jgi:hypothetical protein
VSTVPHLHTHLHSESLAVIRFCKHWCCLSPGVLVVVEVVVVVVMVVMVVVTVMVVDLVVIAEVVVEVVVVVVIVVVVATLGHERDVVSLFCVMQSLLAASDW